MTEEYIGTENLAESYRRMADNVNRSHAGGHFVCTALLARSIVELLVTDVLLRNPGPAAVREGSNNPVLCFIAPKTSDGALSLHSG